MEEPISFWGYKEQESNLILPEHDDDDENTCLLAKEQQIDITEITNARNNDMIAIYPIRHMNSGYVQWSFH